MFSRGKLPGPLRQLQMDLRKLMLPYTALKLKEKKRNNLKDFLNVAGPMGVTHFLVLSKIKTSPVLRVAKTPLKALLSIAPSLPAGSFQESSFGNFFYSHCLSSGTFKVIVILSCLYNLEMDVFL
ncbi:peter Pan-like protein [Gossypium hirsutum]|uniref:Peter Pan-like protein n=1 Tax=Gossypium hirsutum TaxID=3635 RepID=A0ABM3B3R7_GOSHI|nr:peter Pan-like protein [Gossypium hirsutum]